MFFFFPIVISSLILFQYIIGFSYYRCFIFLEEDVNSRILSQFEECESIFN